MAWRLLKSLLRKSYLKEGGVEGGVYFLQANSDQNKPTTGVSVNGQESLYGGTRLAANTWTHLAATYDGTRQRLYTASG